MRSVGAVGKGGRGRVGHDVRFTQWASYLCFLEVFLKKLNDSGALLGGL
jgi:hypothetical protein